MAKISIVKGTTSYLARIFIRDSSSTTGGGLTGLTSASSGLVCYRARDDDGNAAGTAISLSAGTRGTWSSGGFVEKDSTNMPGWYELGIPNAALASGSNTVAIHLKGAANMAPCPIEIELTATNNQDGTAGGISRLDAAVSSRMATFTLPTNFSSFAITAGGAVTVGTNNDKTGYSLTQSFPSNFASMAITVGGAVTAGTVSDKTGYSLSQSFPSNFASLAITAGGIVQADLQTIKTQSVTCSGGVTIPAATLASTTNITAGTITTCTNLTNAPTSGDFTAAMKTSLNAATPASVQNISAQTGDAYARLGAPAGASVSADIASVKTDTGTTIPGRLPSALSANGNIKADVEEIAGNTGGAARLDRSARAIATATVGTGSTTTSIVTSALSPSASANDQFKGRIVIFDKDTTTAALRGQATDITASTSGGVLTVSALTTAAVSGDTFTIT